MTIYSALEIPNTLAAGPGPGNTDPRVLERFCKTGVADHMQKDVLRGMVEAKEQRSFTFEAGSLPSGPYFIRAVGERFADTKQVLLVR